MPQRFRMGNPHTDREIDALWREMHRAQRRVQSAEMEVAKAAEPAPEVPPPDDFSDTQVLIEGGPCLWPTHAYFLPTWNFTETDMTSQFTHPAQWVVWNDYRDDLYRIIALDLHRLHPFYNPGPPLYLWQEETGSATPWQPIWQETVDGNVQEVRRAQFSHRNSYIQLQATPGVSTWVSALCYRVRRWAVYLNGTYGASISIAQAFMVWSDTNNPNPLACADIPAAINAGGVPFPQSYDVALTSTWSPMPSVRVYGVYSHLHIPETAIGAAA